MVITSKTDYFYLFTNTIKINVFYDTTMTYWSVEEVGVRAHELSIVTRILLDHTKLKFIGHQIVSLDRLGGLTCRYQDDKFSP